MLKGIPSILSPELLKVLCEMGHSDRLVIADVTSQQNLWVKTVLQSAWMDMAFQKF